MIEIFILIVLILSASLHEYMHGYAAYRLGDNTAKNAGRLTLNPIKHLDLFGSFLLPLGLYLMKSPFLFGWAKPVPYNPYNLRDQKYGDAKVAAAGPLSNLGLALLCSLIFRALDPSTLLAYLVFQAALINVLLGIFNLVPIPPLDGSKILAVFLPATWRQKIIHSSDKWSFAVLLLFVFFGFNYLVPVIFKILYWMTGISF